MLRVFIGYDARQPVAYNVAQFAVVKNASAPVSVTPLILSQLPIARRGLTEFTYSRFLVPWLSEFRGLSVFMDPDMIVTGDICELVQHADPLNAVSLVKAQPRFEWPSMMVFSNSACTKLTPQFVDDEANPLFDMAWAAHIGDLPGEWNYCIGYEAPKEAKLWHYTQGIPCWPETEGLEERAWKEAFREANSTVSWSELMAGSVHAKAVQERMNARQS